jgi:FkbM family methyltransferase
MDFSKISYRSFLGRMVRLPLRLIPKTAVFPILQGQLRGKRWVVGAGNHSYWLGSYEIRKRQVFEREIKPGMVVFDIGANVGFYSLLAAQLTGKAGKVYAFEPLPRNAEYIHKHVALNKITTIAVFEVAVGDKNGEAWFEPGVSIATGHLSETGTIRVRQVSLDTLMAEGLLTRPDVMKIDVEGAEYDVVRGAQEIIQAYRPLIFLDTHDRTAHTDTIGFLAEMGYQFEQIDNLPLAESKELLASP